MSRKARQALAWIPGVCAGITAGVLAGTAPTWFGQDQERGITHSGELISTPQIAAPFPPEWAITEPFPPDTAPKNELFKKSQPGRQAGQTTQAAYQWQNRQNCKALLENLGVEDNAENMTRCKEALHKQFELGQSLPPIRVEEP